MLFKVKEEDVSEVGVVNDEDVPVMSDLLLLVIVLMLFLLMLLLLLLLPRIPLGA